MSKYNNICKEYASILIWIGMTLFANNPLQGQWINVKDANSLENLAGTVIYNIQNTSLSTLTNSQGNANISIFSDMDSLSIQILGYQTIVMTKQQIINSGYQVRLKPSQYVLEQAVVSASRLQDTRLTLARKIDLIKKEEIQQTSSQTTADVLGRLSGVFIQKSQGGGGSPMIRGFAANRVMIAVDGVRMNNAIFRSGNLQNIISIDPNTIQTAEVMYGPGALMYGSDGIGGVMNIYTIRPLVSGTSESLRKTEAMLRYSTANAEKTFHFLQNHGKKNFGFLFGATYSHFDDFIAGKGNIPEYLRPDYQFFDGIRDITIGNQNPRRQVGTAYNQLNLTGAIRWIPYHRVDVSLDVKYATTSDIPRYDRLVERRNNNLRFGDWYYGPQTWLMNSFKVKHQASDIIYDVLNVNISHQYFEESRHSRNFGNLNRNSRTESVNVLSLNTDFYKSLNKTAKIQYGIELIMNDIASKASVQNLESMTSQPIVSRYPNGAYWNSAGVYANYSKTLNKINFQSGIRYNHIFSTSIFDQKELEFPFEKAQINTGALTGSINFSYHTNKNWKITSSLSTGFRAPNIDDIAKIFDSEPFTVTVPNPGLKPEYAYNADIGIMKTFGNHSYIEISGFYTYLDEAMVRRPFMFGGEDSIVYDGVLSEVIAIQNAANAKVYGVQLAMLYQLNKSFQLNSRINWQTGIEIDESGEEVPLRHAVPFYGNASIAYRQDRFSAEIFFMFQSSIRAEDMPPTESAKPVLYAKDSNGNPWSPSWHTFDLRLSMAINENFRVNFHVENLLDTLYRPYSSGISGMGRNFVLSLRGNF